MSNHSVPIIYRVRDLPKECRERITLAGVTVYICRQKTGFGSRQYFVCPVCSKHRTALYGLAGGLYCRSCAPVDIYRYRRNMYDEGGTALITWHMHRLLRSVGVKEINYPFDYAEYALSRPKYMHLDRYGQALKRVQALENMRFCAIFAGRYFSAAEIKKYTSDNFLSGYTLQELRDFVLFSGMGSCSLSLRKRSGAVI